MKATLASRGISDPAAVLDQLPAAVLVVDERGRILTTNLRAEEILGRPRRELLGAGIESVFAPLARVIAGLDEPGQRDELVVQRRDGSAITIGLSAARTGDGDITMVFTDVSAWTALREERDRLLRLAAVGEALPTLLHELRNPLAAVIATVELMIEDDPGDAYAPPLAAVLAELRRMTLVFDGVGAVGRPLRAYRAGAIDQTVRDAVTVLASQADRAGLQVRCDVPTMPLLPLDAAVMRALVFNLVTNAIHACPPGAVVRVSTRLDDAGRALELVVSDTGPGMSQHVFAHCTNLFFTTKRNGSGIGLAVCQRTVRDAGGELEIRSVPGFGTTVTATIPVVPGSPE